LELDAGLAYLHARVGVIGDRVAATVARRRAGDPSPNDPFRGLYIADADVDRLLDWPGVEPTEDQVAAATAALAPVEAVADTAEARGEPVRLRTLARAFGLDAFDIELLLVALAPDLDPRFERLYGYLHDDVTRRRASIGLALELCGAATGGPARLRFAPHAPLVAGSLLLVEDADRPFLTRSLRVPDRVIAHLVGDDTAEPAVADLLTDAVGDDTGASGALMRAVELGVPLVYLRERLGTSGRCYAAAALGRAGRRALPVDLARLAPGDDLVALVGALTREARLRRCCLVAGPVDVLAERGPGAVRAFADHAAPLVLVGARCWDPRWSERVPLVLEPPMPTLDQRERMWREALAHDVASDLDPAGTMLQFRLAPDQVVRAARAARQQAATAGRAVTTGDLHAGARAQNAAGLERLARRIEPRVGWDDLVLPPAVLRQLRNLTARARHRDRVLDEWGMGRSSKGRGITALFAGESGTGKTISAEVVAHDLGLSLYVIDLATVVDKYVGETEKNLDRIFDEADRVNGVLLFDEADAIFGKRSEVRDAHDRYANVEVAYLLQRMELFGGLAVLTTNLRANVDEAFTRRLDLVVDFPMPEVADRRRLWAQHLGNGVPRADDVDLDFLADAFKLAGGHVRNIALAAAFFAADAARPLSMADLIRATESEYRKLGNLCLEAEFGSYFPLLNGGRET